MASRPEGIGYYGVKPYEASTPDGVAGATGYIRLWNGEGELFEYMAVIHLAEAESARRPR